MKIELELPISHWMAQTPEQFRGRLMGFIRLKLTPHLIRLREEIRKRVPEGKRPDAFKSPVDRRKEKLKDATFFTIYRTGPEELIQGVIGIRKTQIYKAAIHADPGIPISPSIIGGERRERQTRERRRGGVIRDRSRPAGEGNTILTWRTNSGKWVRTRKTVYPGSGKLEMAKWVQELWQVIVVEPLSAELSDWMERRQAA